MKKEQLQIGTPVKVTVNKELDKINTKGMFQDKLDKANDILKKFPPPELKK